MSNSSVLLGVNIDHVATVRQARRTIEPDPVTAAVAAEAGGADQITVHLREDRRHIQDHDLDRLMKTVTVKLNLECACTDEMIGIACKLKPTQVCLVPEKREEVTTEGGLDVAGNRERVESCVSRLKDAGIYISLFIDPAEQQIAIAKSIGADAVELHTGCYANASEAKRAEELETIRAGSQLVLQNELRLDAGHGLTYTNVVPVAQIPGMAELNIGHTIVSRSIYVGIKQAVREMKEIIDGCTKVN